MDNMKFLVVDKEFINKKLENWKCDGCGSTNDPQIIGEQDENGKILEMHIICKECNRDIVARFLEK